MIGEVKVVIQRIKQGIDLVPAIITAVYDLWPEHGLPCRKETEEGCACSDCQYNSSAPEVKALDEFREAIQRRDLGSWKEKFGWAAEHSKEEAITILNGLCVKNEKD